MLRPWIYPCVCSSYHHNKNLIMFTISPQLARVLFILLLLLPWFSLQQKIFFPFLVYSGFDGELIILCELLFSIFVGAFGKHPAFNRHGLLLLTLICCWHISGLISAIASEHFHASLIKQVQYLIHCLFAYSAWVFLRQHGKHNLMATALVVSFMWILFSIAHRWFALEDPYSFNWVKGTPFFNNIRHFGFIQIVILPFLYLPFFSSFRFKNYCTLILLSLFWGSLIWTCSRGTFLSAIIVCLIIPFYLNHRKKELFYLFGVAFSLGWIIALQFPVESGSLNPYRLLFLNYENGIVSSEQLSSGRTEIWIRTLTAMWQHNPLFGLGANGYLYVSPHIWPDSVHPHSGPVQLLTEFGIIGFIFLLSSAWACLNIWRQHQANNIQLISRLGLMGAVIASLVDGQFYHNFSLLFIAILLALSCPYGAVQSSSSKLNAIPAASTLIICLALIWPIQQHWQSFLLQQVPLSDQAQFDDVRSFPSNYNPSAWLTDWSTEPKLLEQALKLGQQVGPYHCKFFQQEFSTTGNLKANEVFMQKMTASCGSKVMNQVLDD